MPRAFHVMVKPTGPICNIDCKYCFYLQAESLYPQTRQWHMTDDVLENFIRQYIQQQDVPEVSFAWQGGEPTLLGVDFFRRVVEIQRRYADGKRIANAFQTNGILINDEWAEFLAAHDFLVGVSIDGPRELHDIYRVDRRGAGTFDRVIRGLDFLKKHNTQFNTLTVVNHHNSHEPIAVYRFLKEIDSRFHQFIPLVERLPDSEPAVPLTVNRQAIARHAHALAEPPELIGASAGHERRAVTDWSVESDQYGIFLCAIFDEWIRQDVGSIFVQLFEVAIGVWMGLPPSLCVFSETCGAAAAIEHNGDLYSCDHYVFPKYRLGNVMTQSLGQMMGSPQQRRFGDDKRDTLPRYCRKCDVRFACNGECPKHRFATTPDGESGLNYLCPSYKRFFHHIDPAMKKMCALLRAGRPADHIMLPDPWSSRPPLPDHPCPCGSGMKFKRCCGKRSTIN